MPHPVRKSSKKKPLFYFSLLLLFVAVCWVYSIYHAKQSKKADAVIVLSEVATSTAEVSLPTSTIPVKPAKKKIRPKVTLAYTEALEKYGKNRMQFDEMCQTDMPVVTYKNNAIVLLDNRAPVIRTIKIGTATHVIERWGFAVVTLSASSLPKTLFVSCDKSLNVATVLLQK